MKTINYISEITSIDSKYLILIIKTLIFFSILTIIKKVGIKILRHIKDNKKVFNLINNRKYKIIEIKPIRKNKGIFTNTFISSYCVIYEKML